MTTGSKSNFTIYNEQFEAGYTETLQQNTQVFNEASRGAIRLIPQSLKGEYEKFTFFDLITGLVTRRDPTSVAAIDDTGVTDSEHVAVKVARRIGPIAQTIDSFKKVGMTDQELSFILGEQVAKAVAVDYVNTALLAAKAAINSNTGMLKNAAGQVISYGYLNDTLRLFGDAASKLVCWVMHSTVHRDLIGNSIDSNVTSIADVAIFNESVGTLNRPVIATDSSSLITTTDDPDIYHVLALAEGAIEVKESEERDIHTEKLGGYENLIIRIQGEYSFNVGLKGYSYQTGSGANPADATIGASAAWSKVVTSDKDTLGAMLNVRTSSGVPTV